MMVDVALGQSRSQPAEKRPAALVAIERGPAVAVAQVKAVKLGVEGVGEFAASGVAGRHGDGGAGEGLAVEGEEAIPGQGNAPSAGAGQSQVGEAQAAQVGDLLFGGRRGF